MELSPWIMEIFYLLQQLIIRGLQVSCIPLVMVMAEPVARRLILRLIR